jgi:hypothetical protein
LRQDFTAGVFIIANVEFDIFNLTTNHIFLLPQEKSSFLFSFLRPGHHLIAGLISGTNKTKSIAIESA